MRIAFCSVIRDEAEYLPEWLTYQRMAGFDTGIIFDNRSTDGTGQILRKFALHQHLIVIDWPHTDAFYQMNAFEHCLSHFRNDFDWIAFIDIDEFILQRGRLPLREHLAAQEAATAAIAINWAMFGSNGHIAPPKGTVLENFTRRSEVSFEPAKLVKSIVRPKQTKSCLFPHQFEVEGDYLLPSGQPVEWSAPGRITGEPDYGVFSVNHYFTKSLEAWVKKLRRGYHDRVRQEEEFWVYDRNEIEDTTAVALGLEVRRFLQAVG